MKTLPSHSIVKRHTRPSRNSSAAYEIWAVVHPDTGEEYGVCGRSEFRPDGPWFVLLPTPRGGHIKLPTLFPSRDAAVAEILDAHQPEE